MGDSESHLRWLAARHLPNALYGLADVFICLSRDEPLGNVNMEAWIHCPPVVSTRTHSATD